MEKRKPSYTVSENANWYSHYGETVWRFLNKLNIELPYDPAIPLLGINPEKSVTQKDTCTPVFIVVLLIITRTWKQPRRPMTDEWIKKMWYHINTLDYY